MLLEPIHGVVVSVGYDDYLDVALTHNRALFGHCCVVTSPEDKASQRVAGKHNCTLVITDDGKGPEGKFNKGLLIERGIQQLPDNGWRIHFDADIVLPANARKCLGTALYDREAIYGADRMNVVDADAWQALLATGWASSGFDKHHFLTYSINRAELGSRLVYGELGWVPIGFLQIWHSSMEFSDIYRTRPYATGSSSAAHDDVQFALRWDRKKRILIPELIVAHLLTSDCTHGKNWRGRKTARFDPKRGRAKDRTTGMGSC